VTKKPAKKKKPAARTATVPAKPSPSVATAAPPAPRTPVAEREIAPAPNYQAAFCITGKDGPPMFGLSARERLRRQFARAGLTSEINAEAAEKHRGPLIIVRADALIDQPLIAVIIKRPGLVLTTEPADGKAVVAANIRSSDATPVIENMEGKSTPLPLLLLQRAPSELEAAYWKALRKRETPYALTVTSANRKSVERRMFMGTYKGATDLVTKHLWPVPAFHTTRFLAPRGVTPNMVTMIAAILTALAFFLFLKGEFTYGILAAWAMTFLDTVDGKLARTTLTSSKWGDVFDHGIDLVHPPFWYAAWAVGLATWGINWSSALFWWVLAVILGGYVLQRLMEGAAIKWLGIEIHIWRPIDTLFRQVTARRNPNLVLLTISTLFQKPDWGLIAVAVWTALCLVLHAIQLAQAFAAKPKGGPLPSWMAGP
jgi:phosphatidylglycerophosphate synthase